ncbi:ArsR/SmtB family transcription factor [Cellulomonas fengjieae]|uniref:Winged helix-turn-helix transcriptional regulator n=1 Tax=Cellulomonas fengjieae TaxID=2819978 RepID=A0ABS3SFF9_9CELL|nr:winged helix-turn-helix domain-containing protein [Cellulomonas fengjieae]MBO3083690.1 winged helix-turn-helix transcriptional regulator [Cellulomonas fengjieae]MBO3101559.1 winged helix-turn-helix transcriptional regulator [Cellulomonas fengjieae]QVI65004.1 winged helix-turn-helix transcriptional regulator [Cellulomonas fengjieae]
MTERAPDLGTSTADADADARALASTLRIRILRLCLDEPLTNREIAQRLGRNPATVLHHVRTLVDRGFLVAQPTRRGARGAREVPYLATRKSWRTPGGPSMSRVLIDAFLEEVALVDTEELQISRLGLRLDAAGLEDLTSRVHAILEEFATRPPDPDGTPYSVFWALHEDVTRQTPPRSAAMGSIDEALSDG